MEQKILTHGTDEGDTKVCDKSSLQWPLKTFSSNEMRRYYLKEQLLPTKISLLWTKTQQINVIQKAMEKL